MDGKRKGVSNLETKRKKRKGVRKGDLGTRNLEHGSTAKGKGKRSRTRGRGRQTGRETSENVSRGYGFDIWGVRR